MRDVVVVSAVRTALGSIGGTLKNTGYYVGGVIGTLQSYSNSTNQKVFQVQDCTISATLAATTGVPAAT